MNTAKKWRFREHIDWQKFPCVVFESDDWGSCESFRNEKDADDFASFYTKVFGKVWKSGSTLESPDNLEKLYSVLEKVSGTDKQTAVFTAFVCLGNPDYERIRANGFKKYVDIGIDEGVPTGWERGDIAGKWREGISGGVFYPEFHARLHHTSPKLWLKLLNGKGLESKMARYLFDKYAFCQNVHLPEYMEMDVKEQQDWISIAIQRFKKITGYLPNAAVDSDAYPVTEVIWSINGVKIFCLKNARINTGEVVVYDTKPWNSQDIYCPMGAYNEENDLIYLNRNVFFECGGNPEQNAEAVLPVIHSCWKRSEPAIISSHRGNYVSLNSSRVKTGFGELEKLLQLLSAEPHIYFLTTQEVGSLYRNGWSLRNFGDKSILRVWRNEPIEFSIERKVRNIISLPEGKKYQGLKERNKTVTKFSQGNYLIHYY